MKCIYKQLGITIWETNIRSVSGTRSYVQFVVGALFHVYIILQLKRAFLNQRTSKTLTTGHFLPWDLRVNVLMN